MDAPDRPNIDPALLDLFRAEMDAHIPTLSQGLLALEKGRADDAEIAAMMRAAHSIKGAARIVGIEAAVRLSHMMEDCFTAARERRITLDGASVDVLLQGVDALQRICSSQPDPELTEAGLEALRERIAAIRDGRAAPTLTPTPTPSAPDRASTSAPAAIAALGDERRVVLPTALDDANAAAVRALLCEALDSGAGRIRLDFANVTRIGASGLALLAALRREAARSATALNVSVEGARGAAATVLRVAALERAGRPGD